MTQSTPNTGISLNATLVTSASQFSQVDSFLKASPIFGFDIETTVVDSVFDRHIRTIQLGTREAQYVLDLKYLSNGDILNQEHCRTPSWAKELKELLDPYFLSRDYIKVGHNLGFEYETMLWCLGIKFFNLHDTYIIEQVLNAGKVKFTMSGFYGLDDVAKRRCNFVMEKDLQTSFNLVDDLTDDQINYAALDTRVPLAIRISQLKEAEQLQLQNVVRLENDAVPYFGDLHVNGFYCDKDLWLERVRFHEERHKKHIEALDQFFIPVYGKKPTEEQLVQFEVKRDELEVAWRAETKRKELRADLRTKFVEMRKSCRELRENLDLWEGEAMINYGSHPQLLEGLKQLGIKLPNTNDDTLNLHSEPVIKALQDYRESAKILTTYGHNWLDYIQPKTGRVHSRFRQIGAETGRTSSTNPNEQNIPTSDNIAVVPDFHHAYTVSDPNNTLVIVDMSGAELRIMGEMSGEQSWIDAFNQGWDVHSISAQLVFPEEWEAGTEEGCAFAAKKKKCKCKVHNRLRNWLKAVNFGLAYGMQYIKLSKQLGIPEEQAKQIIARHAAAFKEVLAWLDKSGQQAKVELLARSITGRIRFFNAPTFEVAKGAVKKKQVAEEKKGKNYFITQNKIKNKYMAMYAAIEREGKNTRVQASNADILKIAGGSGYDNEGKPFLWHLLPQYNAKQVNSVHDEFVVECPEEHGEEVLHVIGDAIERAAAMYMKKIKMEYEGKVSKIWNK